MFNGTLEEISEKHHFYVFHFDILLYCYNDVSLAPEKENLCLYGMPNETWEVTLPAEEVPPELPEPALGMEWLKKIGCLWLQFTVMHGYCLLLSTLELALDLIRMAGMCFSFMLHDS
jgi:hypothetical protein